jgi:hypothetical protein
MTRVDQTLLLQFYWDPHLNYIHEHVSVHWDSCKMTSNGIAWILHHYGGPSPLPTRSVSTIRNCEFFAGTVMTGANMVGGVVTSAGPINGIEHGWEITGCGFRQANLNIQSSRTTVRACQFYTGAGLNGSGYTRTGVVTVDGCTFYSGSAGLEVGLPQSTWIVHGCSFSGSGVGAQIVARAVFHHNRFDGDGYTWMAIFDGRALSVDFTDNMVSGRYAGICMLINTTANNQTTIRIDRNKFWATTGTGGLLRNDYRVWNGNVSGRDNSWKGMTVGSLNPADSVDVT